MKKSILLLLCTVLLLSGCQSAAEPSGPSGGPSVNSSDASRPPDSSLPSDSSPLPAAESGAWERGFQKEMNVNHPFRLSAACKAGGGYYLQNEGYIYYMEAATGRMILLCGKPECTHEDHTTCNAWANTKFLTFYDGKLWYTNMDAMHESLLTLCAMDPDGSNHRDVQALMTPRDMQGWYMAICAPMLWDGEIFFVLRDNRVCKNRLGGDPEDNVTLFELDTSDKLDWDWKFWADGDSAYVMCRYVDEDGLSEAVLYLLGDSAKETRTLWRSSRIVPRGDEIVSYASGDKFSFYIAGGHLYYLADGGFWDADLKTGGETKLAGVSGGQALFTDSEMFLYSAQDRSVTVYGLDGSRKREISLASVFETYDDITSCDPVFVDGSMFYLLCYRGGYLSVASSLFQIDTASGELRELRDWPAADHELPSQDQKEIVAGGVSV